MELQAFVEKCGQAGIWESVPFVEWDKIPAVNLAQEPSPTPPDASSADR